MTKAAICAWLAKGRTLDAFCQRPDAPTWRTVQDWRIADPAFDAAVGEARERGCDAIAEQVLATTEPDYVERSPDGRVDAAHVGWIKTQADIRLRLLACWSGRYGAKIAVDAQVRPASLTDEQRAQEIARLLSVAEQRRIGVEVGTPADEGA